MLGMNLGRFDGVISSPVRELRNKSGNLQVKFSVVQTYKLRESDWTWVKRHKGIFLQCAAFKDVAERILPKYAKGDAVHVVYEISSFHSKGTKSEIMSANVLTIRKYAKSFRDRPKEVPASAEDWVEVFSGPAEAWDGPKDFAFE